MSPDLLFKLANMAALLGWAGLLATPLAPRLLPRLSALLVPGLLSLAYTGLILAFWSGAEGGFGTLENVMILFTQPEIVLAGWLHYLAFDLFVGAWEVRAGQRAGMPFWLVLPCLPLTFLFGPAGFAAFLALRAAYGTFRPVAAGEVVR